VRDEFLSFAQPRLTGPEIAAVVDTLRSGWLTTGKKVNSLEESFRRYVGTGYAVALNSCTAALFLSLKALDIGEGDEVITTPMTFTASVNVIEHVGATPIFADIDPVTWCIDPDQIRKRLTGRTKAIIPVHLYGRPCDMHELRSIADENGLQIVQDCAHAIEGEWDAKNLATYGDIACYSFYATKNLTTGEGGMAATDREDLADRIRILALHGLDKTAYDRYSEGGKATYDVKEPGYKFNMTDILAALGVEGLKLIDERYRRRTEIWDRYMTELSDLPGLKLSAPPGPKTSHGRHLFVCVMDKDAAGIDRDGMVQALKAENIGTGIHFTPVHEYTYYSEKYGLKKVDYPEAGRLGDTVFSLPFTPYLTDNEVGDVIHAVRKIIMHYSRIDH